MDHYKRCHCSVWSSVSGVWDSLALLSSVLPSPWADPLAKTQARVVCGQFVACSIPAGMSSRFQPAEVRSLLCRSRMLSHIYSCCTGRVMMPGNWQSFTCSVFWVLSLFMKRWVNLTIFSVYRAGHRNKIRNICCVCSSSCVAHIAEQASKHWHAELCMAKVCSRTQQRQCDRNNIKSYSLHWKLWVCFWAPVSDWPLALLLCVFCLYLLLTTNCHLT